MSATRSITLALAMAVLLGGCGGCGDDPAAGPDAMLPDPDAAVPTFSDCSADDESFVRNAYLSVLGQRPRSQAEVNVYVDIMKQVRAMADATDPDAGASAHADAPDPRAVVVETMARNPAFLDRWSNVMMDALRVPRIEDQSADSCYGFGKRSTVDDGSLARFVRDNPGSAGTDDGNGRFTMFDLLRSALVLDDVSPIYRAHLYVLVSRPIPAANVPPVQAELARREDFGLVFDSAYLGRDIVCLGCHNSEDAITYHPDPALNRHWQVPGLFEKSIYGDSYGIDPDVAHAPFRYDEFVADIFNGEDGQIQPWGWDSDCGGFNPSGLSADPAGIEGLFGSLSGQRLTVMELEAALDRGFKSLAANGLVRGADNEIADKDAAFAYLVSKSIVLAVWTEIMGSSLVIANYFPRNEASRDLLQTLTDNFITNKFSLRKLIADITMSSYYNRKGPNAGCGTGPYNMPAVFDPWVITDPDPDRHLNGPGDGATALSGRTLMQSAYNALEWEKPRFQTFPEQPNEVFVCQDVFNLSCSQMNSFCQSQGSCCVAYDYVCANPIEPGDITPRDERNFQRGIGVFLKNGERGFRGLDFQARLVWENRFGACNKPSGTDYIDTILGSVTAATTLREVVEVVKDKLIGQTAISTTAGDSGTSEAAAIEAMFGVTLDSPANGVSDLEASTRLFCGALLSSPQFLMTGLETVPGGDVPSLTPTDYQYSNICSGVSTAGLSHDLSISCSGDTLSVTAP